MNCRICSSSKSKILYEAPIRSGRFGTMTDQAYQVVECGVCSSRYLNPFPSNLAEFYQREDYRKQYDGSGDIESFHRLHDHAQSERIARLGLHRFRDKVVADFGAGGGGFLDAVCGFAQETHAIEPARFYEKHLAKKHRYHSSSKDFIATGVKADIAVSFETLEHIEDPLGFLADIFASLKKGGVLYLSTVNYDSIYNDLLKEKYDPFNYRTAHLYYFCRDSLRFLLNRTGFPDPHIGFQHDYDLSNLILWLKDSKPTGLNAYGLFDDGLNAAFKSALERAGKASTLWISAIKP